MNVGKAKVKCGERTTIDNYKEITFDVDYTQVYGCFNDLAPKIKSATSFKLLFWLLANKTNKDNSMNCGIDSFLAFNRFLTENDPEAAISKPTYYNCLNELVNSTIIKKHARNNYAANIFVIWKDKVQNRLKQIDVNYITGDSTFNNPLDEEEANEV